MDVPMNRTADVVFSRREMLRRCGMGFGMLGLAGLLVDDNSYAAADINPLAPKKPHFPAKARQVVHLFMNGGPSHVDTFDPKPLLKKYHGKPLPSPNLRTERKTAGALGSPFAFRRYGQSGIEVSELFARTAELIDDICVIRSLHAEVPNHEPSLMLMNCGDGRLPRPSMGAWITYGLGSENQNLPGFIAMCPGGYPIVATQNWRSAFLPGAYQGTYINTQHTDIQKLIQNIRNHAQTLSEQRRQLDLLRQLNELHRQSRAGDPQLEARIQSFELAYRMQTEATDAFDISREPKSIRVMYGSGVHGRQLLIARRLLERGVRFLQIWSGAGQPWDNHENIEKNHRKLGNDWDQPIAAFLKDLKQRGMLDTTLVMWGGEFGRTPVAELPKLSGRDHNHYGFSMWLAGGGIKGGTVYGATDEFGFAAVENKVHVHDLHATILHLLGFDHEKLTYRYAGRDFRLTDVHGHVIHEIIA
ncbi:MAG: sulfatase [Gemmatales bacterium]|nr:MAG: sulfatase [Gemmatales bacterium]